MCSKGALNDGEFVAKGTLDTLSDEASGVDSLRSVFFLETILPTVTVLHVRATCERGSLMAEIMAIEKWER